MNLDETINAWLAPVSDWFGKVVFFAVPVHGAQLPLILVWLIMGGIVCTLAFRFVNLRGFRHSLQVIRGDYSSKSYAGEATPFQALSTAVSGTVGLGSIGGVAVAVSLGGPGAAFWMVVAGFLGMSTKFAEVTLAVKYRKVRADGTVTGGAMYYVQEALSRRGLPRVGKFLAAFFCVAAVGGSLTIFQVNQAYAQFHEVTGFDSGFIFGLIVAVWVGIVLFGGVKRIVQWTDKLSPFMCLLYVLACLVVLGANFTSIPGALGAIMRGAFDGDAVTGGIVGALIQGFRRAFFANEAGLGSAPMAHATVRTNEPMSQGFAALMEPFLDTVIICLLTALVVVVTGVNHTSTSEGIALTSAAFATVVPWFPVVLAVVAILFALSTVLSWGYYGEQAWTWLFGERYSSRVAYRLFLCSVLSVAGTLKLSQVVNIVDSLNFSMAIPNLIAVYLLIPELRAELAGYWQRVVVRGEGKQHVA
ncbi:MAG TPA: alanine/glycine:cation symporter family protein [Steroidobacteraceae bacterium]|jgi:AGCS family alanine or glycine:cation symporter|nr:alanine/glycine:cation symporter family protein [Steroidobacteraceae bacterium]